MTQTNYGALLQEWDHLSLGLGLTADLLPVVSNPNALISPDSRMQGLGKTPSRYNRNHKVAGIAGWTQHVSTPEEVSAWSKEPDYGICVQTRTVRAIDIDVEDADVVQDILNHILQGDALPMRIRPNSSKCLLVFQYAGELPKRILRLEKGIIELLGSGQQFVACGTHTSGVKYEWITPEGEAGLPESIPSLSLKEIDALWSLLESKFAVAPSTTSTKSTKAGKLANAISSDPVGQFLLDSGHVKSTEKDGRLHIECPFSSGHSTVSADSATTYFPANTGGYAHGHFACLHASCAHRSDDDFKAALSLPYANPLDDFDVIPETGTTVPKKGTRFQVIPAAQFAEAKPQSWIVKGVLPQAEMGVVYGESGSGKSFFVLDLVGSIIRGEEWRGHRVKQGNAVYICAEGAGGMRSRLRAYSDHYGCPLGSFGLGVIPDAPNFMQAQDVKGVLEGIKAFGSVSVIVVDTFAQVMAGANENAGEDVGKALAHCKALHRHTGALVLLIHHSGKDASKGARGWSGLRAAADVEIEIVRAGDDRVATLTKLKDGVDGAEYGFKLLTVPVGLDEDDEPVSSCVIEYTAAGKKDIKKVPKGSNELLAMKVLAELVGVGGGGAPWHDLVERMVSQLTPPDTGKRDRRRELVVKAVDKLVIDGVFTKEGGALTMTEGEMK